MDSLVCKTCKYFVQHYYLDSQYGAELDCGHCFYGRVKHCKPQNTACTHYELKTAPASLPDRAHVVQFLTTEFLERILKMELPPEIRKKDEGFD